MLIAQISDLHITAGERLAYGKVDTTAALKACVRHLLALEPQPDVIVATGDLVDCGLDAEYEVLKALLAPLPQPVLVIPGNHDDRAALRRAFRGMGYLPEEGPFLQYVVADGPVRLIGLDTLVPEAGHGALCADRLRWLADTLAEAPDAPTVVMMHHPPFRTGILHMDEIGLLEGMTDLAAIIGNHVNVERVICGHVHRAVERRYAGTLASICPSTSHQVTLDLRPKGPPAFVLEPPAIQLHLWTGDGITSHTSVIGAYDGPYPFFAEGALIV
ncbi:MAG: phosphodiesterase [Rhodospirillales bacterium]|nr:MAG: phosphodiesterase [Rhodospirillales bacterium]